MRQERADQKRFHLLYRTTCLITNKYYVGIHSTNNIDDGYLGSGKILARSMIKHGKENHLREVIEFCSTRKIASQRENEEVANCRGDLLCMNIAPGGSHDNQTWRKISETLTGWKFSDEHRQKLSIAARNRPPMSDEQKERLRQANLGKHLDAETRSKQSAALKGRKKSPETIEKMKQAQQQRFEKQRQENEGSSLSEETRKKIGVASSRRIVSAETRQKLSDLQRGKKRSDETKAKLKEWWRKRKEGT